MLLKAALPIIIIIMFLSKDGKFFNVQSLYHWFYRGAQYVYISSTTELIEEGLILGPKNCKHTERYGILPNTSNLRLCSSVKPPLHCLL